jgi:DivIVA domain-containing protein
MPLSPQDVAAKQFTVVRLTQGYKMDEVDAFLDEVEGELGRLLRDNDELRTSAVRGGAAPAAVAAPPVAAPVMPPPTAAPAAAVAAGPPVTDSAVRMLELAQRTADDYVNQAKAEAQRILDTARAEHARTVSDLEAQRTALQAKVDELRAFEREYRTRLRGYLESQLRDLDARGGVAPGAPASAAPPAPPAAPPAPPAPPAAAPPAAAPHLAPPAAAPPAAAPHLAPPSGAPASAPAPASTPAPAVAPPAQPSRPFSPVPSPIADAPTAPPVQPD